ncbi:MAG: 2OG-Fe(II) oxygenase [Rhodospirillaceae bacterium]|nr:2OG-Fe(II) oxygenase [Rhodospirillaceae bacterium]
MHRLNIEESEHPHFIGAWRLDDLNICDDIVRFFDAKKDQQDDGSVGLGIVDKTVKNSTDLVIQPRDLENKEYAPLNAYIDQLYQCYLAYTEEWPFIASFVSRLHIGRFNIQRYDQDGHFNQVHSERTSLNTIHRLLVWMTYLDDVPDGGETEFIHYGLKIRPEKGKTLIWPAEWTHAHRCCPVIKVPKHVITGWMYFATES